jgi:hypothetical protein
LNLYIKWRNFIKKMSDFSIKISKEEIIKAKFIKTISLIQSYKTEAEGDIGMRVTYPPNVVCTMMKNIENEFVEELIKFTNDIGQIEAKVEG